MQRKAYRYFQKCASDRRIDFYGNFNSFGHIATVVNGKKLPSIFKKSQGVF